MTSDKVVEQIQTALTAKLEAKLDADVEKLNTKYDAVISKVNELKVVNTKLNDAITRKIQEITPVSLGNQLTPALDQIVNQMSTAVTALQAQILAFNTAVTTVTTAT